MLGSGGDLESVLKREPISCVVMTSEQINAEQQRKVTSICQEGGILILRRKILLEVLFMPTPKRVLSRDFVKSLTKKQ